MGQSRVLDWLTWHKFFAKVWIFSEVQNFWHVETWFPFLGRLPVLFLSEEKQNPRGWTSQVYFEMEKTWRPFSLQLQPLCFWSRRPGGGVSSTNRYRSLDAFTAEPILTNNIDPGVPSSTQASVPAFYRSWTINFWVNHETHLKCKMYFKNKYIKSK